MKMLNNGYNSFDLLPPHQASIETEAKSGLVWFDALRPGQQFFSHVGTEPPLPGYYQYFVGGGGNMS